MNYFSLICIAWAAIGIGSRALMLLYGNRWNEWELSKAYTQKRPFWVNIIGVFAVVFAGFTWYMVITEDVRYSWIIGLMMTFMLFKMYMLLFNYERFREFVKNTLNDRKKRLTLNSLVFFASVVFLLMGLLLY